MGAESIILDGLQLNHIDRSGVWKVNSIEGWWDSPAVRADDMENLFGDGEIPGMIFYGSRTLVISGRVIAKSHDYLHEAIRLLTGLNFRKYAVLAVEGHGPVQTASVRVNGRITFSQRSEKYLQYEIPLRATDPFKYGEARSFNVALGSTGQVFHRGTVEAWPNMIITGDMPSYTVRFRGVDVEVPGGILPGQTHRIEYRTRRLYENNSFVMGGFGATNFRPVDAGIRSDLQLIAPSGSGQVKMTVNDTYL